MRETLLIIDDFLDNAVDLRQAALRLTFPEPQQPGSGRISAERINIEGLDQQVSWLVNELLLPIREHRSHARFQLRLQTDSCEAVLTDSSVWCGLLYLSRTADSSGGLDFLRHIPTDTDGLPNSEMRQQILDDDAKDDSRWDSIMHIPVRFNRLVLFRPELWHRPTQGFGDHSRNGQLTYSVFFNSAEA